MGWRLYWILNIIFATFFKSKIIPPPPKSLFKKKKSTTGWLYEHHYQQGRNISDLHTKLYKISLEVGVWDTKSHF